MSSSKGQGNVHQDENSNDSDKSNCDRKASTKDGGLETLIEGARGHREALERLTGELNFRRDLDSAGAATGGNAGSNQAWAASALETGAATARESSLYQLEPHQVASTLSSLLQARIERSVPSSSVSRSSFAAPAMPFPSSTNAASVPSAIGQGANGVDYAPLAAAIASLLQADRRSMPMAQPPAHPTILELLRANAPDSSSLMDQLAPAPPISSLAGLCGSHQLPSSSLHASLLGKLELASRIHNTAELPAITQNLSAGAPHQRSSLDHYLASVQACQKSSLALSNQLMIALENENLSRQILASLYLEHTTSPDFPLLLQKIDEENRDRERLVSSLLLHQQSSVLRTGAMSPDAAQDSGQSLAPRSIPTGHALKSDRAQPPPLANDSNYPHEAPSPPTQKATECLVDPNPSKESRWMVRYEELKRFKQKYGHCRVPHGYEGNRSLGWWVMNQRAQYRQLRRGLKSWISEDRIDLLNAIDFDWKPANSKF